MGRRRKGNIVNGWINLDKPSDMTSTDAVNIVRRALNAQKAGHGGTLDPLATGILPIALGEATKTIPYCQDHMKRYSFRVIWGEARDTDDAEGDVIETSAIRPSEAAILAALPAFTGDIEQIPPQFSAIKIDGERAYDRAREGKENKLAPRPVYIEELTLTDANADSAGFSCLCGKGTYMRSLARDLSKALGTVGYIADLRREAVGPLTTDNAISLAKLREIGDIARSEAEPDALEDVLLPVETVLDDIPALALNEKEAARLRNGQKLLFIARPDMDRLGQIGLEIGEDATALAIYNGKPIALVAVAGAEISPVRVLNL
ncbi:MAG: tRNA pseudouridine(55) synthase TruB [Rhodospirillales bacterium]|nr:tRNA pseudouridine(55) synthase TruB [Rhodospirillales bacterium]MCB9995794.1 tRNA pseudouridine(55) synthase TruB [Rhodospirillales bacterium]